MRKSILVLLGLVLLLWVGCAVTKKTTPTTPANAAGGGKDLSKRALTAAASALANSYQAVPIPFPPLTGVVQPIPPTTLFPPPFPVMLKGIVRVATFTELQNALANAQCGQFIVLTANITTGIPPVVNIKCPPGQWLVLTSQAAVLNSGPRIGTTLLPSISTSGSGNALIIGWGSTGVYVTQIGFTTVNPPKVYPIITMCESNPNCTSYSSVPNNIWFDRVQVYAPPPANLKVGPYVQSGIKLNCTNCGVIHSRIWGIYNYGQDAQGVLVNNSPGPVLVWDNDIQASGENVMTNTSLCGGMGGNYPLPGWTPPPGWNGNGWCGWGLNPGPAPQIYVIGNSLHKDPSWNIGSGDIKNLLEFKMVGGAIIDHNVFWNTWAGAQSESFILNCFAPGPYVCSNISITNNYFHDTPTPLVINGNGTPQTGQNILVENNLMTGNIGGSCVAWQSLWHFTYVHNTCINTGGGYGWAALLQRPPSQDNYLTWLNSIQYGQIVSPPVQAGGTVAGELNSAWGGDLFVGDWWPNNYPASPGTNAQYFKPLYPTGITTVVSTAQPANSPPCNWSSYWPSPGVNVSVSVSSCWPLNWALVGLVDFAGASSGTNPAGAALAPTSPYHGKATDQTDPGANVAAVLAAVAGVQ